MAAIRESWHIINLRSLFKRYIRNCSICKVFSTKPYGANLTAALPRFRTDRSLPFELTGVDFEGPITYKVGKKEEVKAYILIFTCAVMRAIHMKVTKPQTAEEFTRK